MAGSRLDHIKNYIRQNGVSHTAYQAFQKVKEHYLKSYDRWYQKNQTSFEGLEEQHLRVFKSPPLISVVVPVFNTRADYLKQMAMSVIAQSYPHWELCLLDGGSERAETLAALEELRGKDKRIRVERAQENLGIAGNTNLAIAMARGSYIALLDHDDTLSPDALYWIADAIETTGAELLYSDEDKMQHDGKYLFTPHLKPDYSPDLLRSCNYFCHLMVLKTDLLKRIGGLQAGFD
ncbi:MAG: glycosyltransferase, partial [Clostridia bacterium]|nr:glycosyltransferase [Clostridia bacterium]